MELLRGTRLSYFRYLQEYTALGTAGGMYHFRDQIRCGNPAAFFVINGDVCGDFPLLEMCNFYWEKNALIVVAGTEATRNQSINYGNLCFTIINLL